jgi:hypothetical protein
MILERLAFYSIKKQLSTIVAETFFSYEAVPILISDSVDDKCNQFTTELHKGVA